jgi:hypothetical protein
VKNIQKEDPMSEKTATARPTPEVSLIAARLSFAASATFVALVVALHFLKPELDPSWRMVSEYEIGHHGWVMQLAFLSLALSCVALFVAVRPDARTAGGKIGLILLLICAAGMTIAAVFATDPTTASRDELTTRGNLHGLGTLLGIPGFPIAATLISRSLARDGALPPASRPLLWAAALTWVGLLAFVASVAFFLPRSAGGFGPEVPIGWPNRLLVLAYSAWLMVAAWQAVRARTSV